MRDATMFSTYSKAGHMHVCQSIGVQVKIKFVTPLQGMGASQNPLLDCFHHRFAAAGYVELFIDMFYMGAHRFITDKGFAGNVFIVMAFHH